MSKKVKSSGKGKGKGSRLLAELGIPDEAGTHSPLWSMPAIKKDMEKIEGASAAGSSAMDVDVNPKDGPLYTNFADAVDAIIMGLPARTRAKTKVVRRNAIEAGIVAPAESSKTAAASAAGKAASEADSDVFEEDKGLQDFGGTGVDNLAWNAWERAQVDYVRQLQSKPRQTLRVVRSFLADLHYRYDDADDMESPRTFDVQWKHWQEFDTMITALMDQGKGREMAYLKIEVPLEAFSAAKGRYHRDDVQLQTHRLQLKPLPHHGQFDNRGVYRVTLSKTFKDVSSDVWRVIMRDYENETRPREKEEGESVRVKEEIQTSYRASWTPAPSESSGMDSSPAPPTPAETGKPAPRSTVQPKCTKSRPIRTPKSFAQRKAKATTPSRPIIVSKTAPRFTEKELIKAPTPDQARYFSPNQLATPELRSRLAILPVPIPYLQNSTQRLHLSGNPGTTIGLFTLPTYPIHLSPNPNPNTIHPSTTTYTTTYLYAPSAPLNWTIIPPASIPRLLTNIHASLTKYPRQNSPRPRFPPMDCLACKNLFVGRETLKQWGVEWKGVKQLQGEVLVLGEGAWGEWWSEEAGVVEVGVVRVGSLGGYAAGEYAAGGYGGVHHEGRGACVECLWRYGMQVVEEVEEMDVDVDQPPEGEEGEGYVGKGKGKEVVR